MCYESLRTQLFQNNSLILWSLVIHQLSYILFSFTECDISTVGGNPTYKCQVSHARKVQEQALTGMFGLSLSSFICIQWSLSLVIIIGHSFMRWVFLPSALYKAAGYCRSLCHLSYCPIICLSIKLSLCVWYDHYWPVMLVVTPPNFNGVVFDCHNIVVGDICIQNVRKIWRTEYSSTNFLLIATI